MCLSSFRFVEFTEENAICKANKLSLIKQGKRGHFLIETNKTKNKKANKQKTR